MFPQKLRKFGSAVWPAKPRYIFMYKQGGHNFFEKIRFFFRTNPYKKIRIIRTFKKIRTIFEKKIRTNRTFKKN